MLSAFAAVFTRAPAAAASAAPAAPAAPLSNPTAVPAVSAVPRNPLIDLCKGLACAAIVWHHLAFYGPMSDSAQALAPELLRWLYDNARMAVQGFLVLGGYLAAAQLAPEGRARFGSVAVPIVRRCMRLAVPYAVALVVAVLAAALVRPWLEHPSVPDEPTLAQLLANALMLQDIVGEDALSAGVWYVAIDLQLFVLTALLLAGVRALPGLPAHQSALLLQALVVACTAASLWAFNRVPELDMWALYFFGAYGLGLLAYWSVQSRRPALWTALLLVLGAVALALEWRTRIAVAWAVALGLVWMLRPARPCLAHTRALSPWLTLPALVQATEPLQALGRMSYSVFLVHFSVCLLTNALVHQLWPGAPWPNALGMVAGFALSLVAGRVLYQRVERHVPSWSLALRWQAGLVGAGLLAARAGTWL